MTPNTNGTTVENMHTQQALKRIEDKLDKLLERIEARLATMPADPTATDDPSSLPGYEAHAVTRIEHYISGSGNPTWKAFTDAGDLIYLRQAHKQLLSEAGLWDELNTMQIGEQREMRLDLGTVPDGDFLKPVFVKWTKISVTWRSKSQVEADPFYNLRQLVESTDYVVIDTETTDLHGYVCQLAVIAQDGEVLLHRLIKPPRPIEPGAARVHGITNEMVQNAVTLADPSVEDELRHILAGVGAVVGWNVTFDKGALTRSAERHDLPHLVKLLTAANWIDVMGPYSKHVAREWSDYHQNYKWQKLTSAAAHYGISTEGAHGALADARMTLQVLKAMVV
jgi:DNA polymerase III epsilon subunit-like protein